MSEAAAYFYPVRGIWRLFVFDHGEGDDWFEGDVLSPGSFQFEPAYAPTSEGCQNQVNTHINACAYEGPNEWNSWELIAPPDPVDPPIPLEVTRMAVQVKFPPELPPVDRVSATVGGYAPDLTFHWAESVGTQILQDDGSWLIPLEMEAQSNLVALLTAFNNPDPEEAPDVNIDFEWFGAPGSTVPLTGVWTLAGVWFYVDGDEEPPPLPCEVLAPVVSAWQLVVHERSVGGVLTSHGFTESDVVAPGSIYFQDDGGPAWYANGVTNQLQLVPLYRDGDDAVPLNPPVTPDGLLEMTVQVKFPASIDPEPDWVEGWMSVRYADTQYQWVGPYGSEPGGNTQYRGEDGVWRIPFLHTDEDHVSPWPGWSLENLLNGLNDPTPGVFEPYFIINFGWLADVWGSPRIPILEPFTDMGLSFRYCEVDEPVEVLVGVAPPLRIYPRHDQSAMGTPRVFPKSPSRQHGNRVGPGSYT